MKNEKKVKPDQWLNFAEGYAACVEAAFQEGYKIDKTSCEEQESQKKSWKEGWKRAEKFFLNPSPDIGLKRYSVNNCRL